jgi:putative membrane protein
MIDTIMQKKMSSKIKKAEEKSSCELVAMITQKSDEYTFIPIMYAALFSLIYPMIHFIFFSTTDLENVYNLQLLVFVVMLMVAQNPYMKYALIPKSVKHKRASHNAHKQFIIQGLHQTSNHQAVLFFVSVKEKYVEIIVDSGISEKVENEFFENIVHHFTKKVKEGQFAEGYLEAIEMCSNKLIETFPSTEDHDVLPNELIIV